MNDTMTSCRVIYLVGAPVPNARNCGTKKHASPGNVRLPGHYGPEEVHSVGRWFSTISCIVVGISCCIGDGIKILVNQLVVATHFFKCYE